MVQQAVVCPTCGGPASEETFWSMVPEAPHLRRRKRIVRCSSRSLRPRRGAPEGCPIYSEIVAEEAIPLPETPPCETSPPVFSEGETPCETSPPVFSEGETPSETSPPVSTEGETPCETSPPVFSEGDTPSETSPPGKMPLEEVARYLAALPEDAIGDVVRLAHIYRLKDSMRREIRQRWLPKKSVARD